MKLWLGKFTGMAKTHSFIVTPLPTSRGSRAHAELIGHEQHLFFSPPPTLQPTSSLSSTIKILTPYEDMVHAWHVIHSSKEQHSPASLTFPMVQSRWKWSHCLRLMHWSSSYSRIWRNQHLYDNSFYQQR